MTKVIIGFCEKEYYATSNLEMIEQYLTRN